MREKKSPTNKVEDESKRERVVSTEWERTADGNGRRLRAERKQPPYTTEDEWQQSWAQYQPHPNTFHSDCSVRLGSAAKIQLFKMNLWGASEGFGGVSVKLLWVLTDRTVQQQDGVWQVVKWYRRFLHIMAVFSKPSQKIVGYWLLGGYAPGLLWCCFEYDELPL